MKSQKNSSTKVGAKNAAPTGQRQYSNLLRSQAAVVKAQSKPGKKTIALKAVSVPVAKASQLRYRAPVQRSLDNGGLNVKHCEFIGPVYKPATQVGYQDSVGQLFQALRLRINPGSKSTFNWLSTVAPLFENFRFKKCVLHYETRCSTSDRGSIIMSPDYDAADGQIALSEKLLFSNKNTVDDTIWKHVSLRLDPSAMNRLYKGHPCMSDIRFSTTKQDQKTIDPAQVFVCVDTDNNAAFKFGKIFIEYDIDFFDPQNPSESPTLGGFSSSLGSFITGGSTKPISGAQNLTAWKIDQSTITPTTSIPEVTYPSAVLGRFNKDFEGLLATQLKGTGLGAAANYYVGSDPLGSAGSGDDTLISLASLVNTAATLIQGQGKMSALAGQYLKFSTPGWATFSEIDATLGGLSVANQY